MKALEIIKKIIVIALCVAFFAFAIVMTILLLNINKYGFSQFDNTTLITLNTNSSSGNFKKGDLVFVENKKMEDIKIGDELFVYKVNSDGTVNINMGIIKEIHTADEAISFEDGTTYSIKFLIGEATKTYNKIGSYLSIIESKWGFLFIILVPSFLIFVYEFYALIIEIKYGKEEEN